MIGGEEMKINWALRFKNKATLAALIGTIVAFVYQIATVLGFTLPIEQSQIMDAVSAVLILLAGLGVIVDPTTEGTSDSEQALEYKEPKGE